MYRACGQRTEPAVDLVGLGGDKEADTVMLAIELVVKVVFEAAERSVLLSGNGDGGGLVACGVDLDKLLERVVVNVVKAPFRDRFGFQLLAVFHGRTQGLLQ